MNFKELLNTSYYTISHNNDDNLLETSWLPTTEEMSEDDYKEHVSQQTEVMSQHQVQLFLADCSSFAFVVNPDLQEWGDETQVPKMIKAGVRKIAVLLPETIFAQISVEQLSEESNVAKIEQKIFGNKDEALEWLVAL